MNTSILDTITAAFVGALQAGTAALAAFSLPLLGVFAIIAFYVQVGPLVASGGMQVGDAVASLLLTAVKTGVFYWLLVNLSPLADAAFQTFLQWGVAPSGGVTGATFLAPSKVLDVGFVLATPIRDYTDRLIHWAAVWNWPTLLTYTLTYYLILVSFGFIALHLMMTMIEYHLAVLAGAVLLPWGVLQPTAFFAEFSLGWLTGGLVRVLVTGAIVGIAVPLFSLVKVATTSGNDPTFYSALVVAITSGIFAILSWVIPGRAAAIAGRGVSLALHGGTLVAGAAGGLRGVLAVTAAVRGISSLVRRH